MPSDDAQDIAPCWRADPTGRHDYRWWTGVGWSDQVGDRGAVTIDDGPLPLGSRPSRAAVLRRRRRIAGTVVTGFLLIGGAGVGWSVVQADQPADGLGVHVLDPDPTMATAEQSLRLRAGDAVRIRVEPSTRVDTAVHVLTDEATARAAAVILVEGSGDDVDGKARTRFPFAADVLTDVDAQRAVATQVVMATFDTGAVARPDAGSFTAPVDGDYRIVIDVRAARGLGPVRLVVERFADRYDPTAPGAAVFFDDPFFTDPDFYRSAAVYESKD